MQRARLELEALSDGPCGRPLAAREAAPQAGFHAAISLAEGSVQGCSPGRQFTEPWAQAVNQSQAPALLASMTDSLWERAGVEGEATPQ